MQTRSPHLRSLLASLAISFAAALHPSPALAQAAPPPSTGEGWVDLFNGKDLTGWTTWGEKDSWAAVDGELRAVKPGKGWWLRTTRMYRDFELSLEFLLPPGGNSGVGLRGSNNGDPAFTGFHFATVGAEFGLRLYKGLSFNVGVDVHVVRRALPPDRIVEGGKSFETNYIFPVNAGFLYRVKAGRVRPYLGADAIFSHIRTACLDVEAGACEQLNSGEGAALLRDVDYVLRQNWAYGGRGRLGLDVLINPHVGINLDVALGYWTSRDWPNVDPRQPTGGFLPHIGGGLLFAF